MSDIAAEIGRRKTFAIISHPDAGKTTLTEKLLLYGGAIQTAGAVKSNKVKKSAMSDFMEIEKQRGISVATSVMGFEYKGGQVNILDTPGHKDFAEDTYRTLTAVDSVILVVDCVKGVEEQTENLMRVCRMRNTPAIIFVNKMDREGKDNLELMDELESKLNIRLSPVTWPIGKGTAFRGVYNIYKNSINVFKANRSEISDEVMSVEGFDDPRLSAMFPSEMDKLREETELVTAIYGKCSTEDYRNGTTAPVFFGSAVNNFGIKELLEEFLAIAPNPQPRETSEGTVYPTDEKFTGFVFKIHANLDPNHRDRIAFLRICSGKFERNKFYYHPRTKKKIRFSSPTTFMANERSLIEESFPGDVIGLYDTGTFKIGDSLTEGADLHFLGIPRFSPEIFRVVENKDSMKAKQLEKGLEQLTDEGLAQLYIQHNGSRKIIGTLGQLQFDVLQFRLEHEYGAKCNFMPANIQRAVWVFSDDKKLLEDFFRYRQGNVAYDKDGQLVYMAESEWVLNRLIDENPKLQFRYYSEMNTDLN